MLQRRPPAATLLLLIPLLAASPTTAPSSPLLTEARRILANVKESHYTHGTAIDESAGSYHCDCSGFVGYVLKRTAPDVYKLVPHKSGKRPLAVNFYDAFESAPPTPASHASFQHVESLADARPGDVIAWRKIEQKAGENTGHVVLLDAPPTPDGANVFRITVIDSTSTPHADDTRKPDADGVGRGTLWMKTDDAGHPTGYRWKSNGDKFTDLPIAIGRAINP